MCVSERTAETGIGSGEFLKPLSCHSERSEESAQANDENTHFAPGQIPHFVRNDKFAGRFCDYL